MEISKGQYLVGWSLVSFIALIIMMFINAGATGNLEVTSGFLFGISMLSFIASIIVNVVYKMHPEHFEPRNRY
jgi:uncharacterized membrane protein (DUF485 family)